MKINIQIELMPFKIPDYVVPVREPGLKQDGFPGMTNQGNIPLNQLSKGALEEMCDIFKRSVLKKAGY